MYLSIAPEGAKVYETTTLRVGSIEFQLRNPRECILKRVAGVGVFIGISTPPTTVRTSQTNSPQRPHLTVHSYNNTWLITWHKPYTEN
jgi:hypothetical protein